MIKIVFDGNSTDGYSIHSVVPSGETTNLIVTEADTLHECLPKLRQAVLDIEGYDIFEREFVIVHEDSAFEPGPHDDGLIHHEPLELQGFDKEPGDLIGKGAAFDPDHTMTSKEMLEAIAEGRIDPATLPQSYPDEGTLGVGAPTK